MAEINTPVAKVLDGERAATFDEQLIPRVTKRMSPMRTDCKTGRTC